MNRNNDNFRRAGMRAPVKNKSKHFPITSVILIVLGFCLLFYSGVGVFVYLSEAGVFSGDPYLRLTLTEDNSEEDIEQIESSIGMKDIKELEVECSSEDMGSMIRLTGYSVKNDSGKYETLYFTYSSEGGDDIYTLTSGTVSVRYKLADRDSLDDGEMKYEDTQGNKYIVRGMGGRISKYLNVKSFFNVNNISSAQSYIILIALIILFIVSIIMIVIAIIKLIRFRIKPSLKTLIIVGLAVASAALAFFVVKGIYSFQLKSFGDDSSKTTQATKLNTYEDTNGYRYLLDGNGYPFLSLALDEELSDTKKDKLRDFLSVDDVDKLYVNCNYDVDGDDVTITDFYLQNDENGETYLDLTCSVESGDIIYTLDAGFAKIRYTLTVANDYARTDVDGTTNFLIVGHDRVALNTDVMILVSLHREGKGYTANILQIPRDTYCRDNSPNNKINAVFGSYYGQSDESTEEGMTTDGMEGLVGMLERNMLLKIDYWAIMDLDGFSNIVDAVGGVDMYVPFDMTYVDPTAVPVLTINLPEGQQNLDGNKAEQFIRYRSGYVNGDLGRVDATKIFLTAFFVKLRSELSITNPQAMRGMVDTFLNYVTTNMDLGTAVTYLECALQVGLEDIKFYSLPGSTGGTDSSGLSFVTVNHDGLYYVLNNYFNVYDTDINKSDFDMSRMFTTSYYGSSIDSLYSSDFDIEQYGSDETEGADDIKEGNDNGENPLDVAYGY